MMLEIRAIRTLIDYRATSLKLNPPRTEAQTAPHRVATTLAAHAVPRRHAAPPRDTSPLGRMLSRRDGGRETAVGKGASQNMDGHGSS